MSTSAHPWYREPWPWLLMLGPALVIVAGAVTVALAIASDDGVIAEDYYKRGLAIDRVLARDARARELGLSAKVERPGGDRVEVRIAGGEGMQDARPSRLLLVFVHPGRAAGDRRVELLHEGDRYAGDVALDPGVAWRVVLESERWRLADLAIKAPRGAAAP